MTTNLPALLALSNGEGHAPAANASIAFRTLNSTYHFAWSSGAAWGWLYCMGGTFAGQAFLVRVEDVRDLAWTGERLRATRPDGMGDFTTSRIVWTDRNGDCQARYAATCQCGAGLSMYPAGTRRCSHCANMHVLEHGLDCGC